MVHFFNMFGMIYSGLIFFLLVKEEPTKNNIVFYMIIIIIMLVIFSFNNRLLNPFSINYEDMIEMTLIAINLVVGFIALIVSMVKVLRVTKSYRVGIVNNLKSFKTNSKK